MDGSVTRTYRRWTTVRPRVGSRFTTRAGMVEVAGITAVEAEELGDADAVAAGFADLTRCCAGWSVRPAVRGTPVARGRACSTGSTSQLAGPDPRVALRADDTFDEAALTDLGRRLDRMDAAAEAPWTRPVLRQIGDRPGVVSTVLAEAAGMERPDFKFRVRRLKALGLTESLEVGYRLSPRGRAFLAADRD